MPAQKWQELFFKNPHPRDARIVFDEPTHTYTIDGSYDGWVSTTTFIHEFFGHFDADAVIKKMMAGPKWPSHKLYGMTAEEIKKLWSDSGTEASAKGTALHLGIEQVMHGHDELVAAEVKATPEWRYFENFWRDFKGVYEPYRSEWEVFTEHYKLAGSIDMVFRCRDKPDEFHIYDWKRSKEIKKSNHFQKGLGPLAHYDDCNYIHYSLQLNIYRWYLETYYGIKVTGLYLVIFHPNNQNYHRFRLNMIDEEVQDMLACRKAALDRGLGEKVYLGDCSDAPVHE